MWVLSGAALVVARSLAAPHAVAIYAAAAPIAAATVAAVYYGAFNRTTPLATAGVVVAVVMLFDLVVALVWERSLAMFDSVLGTWLPFALVFAQTLVSGLVARRTGVPGSAP